MLCVQLHERERERNTVYNTDYWKMREVVEGGGRGSGSGGGRGRGSGSGGGKWGRKSKNTALVPLSASLQRRKVARDDGNEFEHSK